MKDNPYLTCEHCEENGEDVEVRVNPYTQDIHNEISYEFICDTCYDTMCDDI